MKIASGDSLNKRKKIQLNYVSYIAIYVLFIQDLFFAVSPWHCDWIPVHNWGTSSCHHGPDPASGVEQGEFEAGTTLGIQVGNVGLLLIK